MKLLFIGDIVGKSGRKAVKDFLPLLMSEYNPDIVIANGENAANGFGITAKIARELFDLGIEVLTTGNHIWDKKDVLEYIQNERRLIRPANYPEDTPGRGSTIVTTGSGHKVAVLNLSGRIFMDPLDCPFKTAEKEIEILRRETDLIFVDFHFQHQTLSVRNQPPSYLQILLDLSYLPVFGLSILFSYLIPFLK